MKVASKLVLILLVVFSNATYSRESSDHGEELIGYVNQKVGLLIVKLEENIERCSIEKKNANLPKVNKKIMASFGVDRISIVQGLSYLANRNFENCEGSYRVDLAYQLGVMKKIGDYYGVKTLPINAIKNTLIYPSSQEVQFELVFNKFPLNAREYILKAVGKKPFNLLKTISENKLLDEWNGNTISYLDHFQFYLSDQV